MSFGIQAKEKQVTEAYKPANFDDIPDGLKDLEGHWFTIHYGTLGLFVNVDALGGAPVPTSWSDLLKPEYKGTVGYLDPSSAFVGYAGAVAVNPAMGGNAGRFLSGHRLFQETEGKPAHRAQADLVRPRPLMSPSPPSTARPVGARSAARTPPAQLPPAAT